MDCEDKIEVACRLQDRTNTGTIEVRIKLYLDLGINNAPRQMKGSFVKMKNAGIHECVISLSLSSLVLVLTG